MDNPLGLVGLFFAAMLGGAVNSLAGGGSLISFPSLVAFGEPTLIANATNTTALWPGSVGGALGFWQEVSAQKRLLVLLLVPSLIGGLLGAIILTSTPEATFRRIVPFLVLFATLIFAGRDYFTRLANTRPAEGQKVSPVGSIWGMAFQLAIATYGGYFGAGQSIMMMGSLSVMGLHDIHRINGLKTALAVAINGIALVYLALRGFVVWHLALLMGVGAIIGGYASARISKRIDQRVLRLSVIAVGMIVSAWLLLRP